MVNTANLATTNQTKVYFGLVFDVDGKEVSLEPTTAINEIKENGIECGLPDNTKVSLGRAGDRINGILKTFGTDSTIPTTDEEINETLPEIDALKTAYKKVVDAVLTIEDFHVKIPGSKAKAINPNSSTLYTIGLSATWPEIPDTAADAGDTGVGSLALKGIYLTVSNEK
ncbi:MAG: hypothetical protein QNJ72_05490 [Pleurocapsa sp. MO_226.B13]|nr:hypothetical protein [Pleurocapsa sp. MO_226.B13]